MAKGILEQISRSNGGVPKLAVNGPVALTGTGIDGDRQRNLRYHGGPDKAILLISADILDGLRAKGYPVIAGALGENLTVRGLDVRGLRSGQQYRVGDALIELTTLRVPCANLYRYGRQIGEELYDSRCEAGDFTSPCWAHGGFYARVLRGSTLVTGAEVELVCDVA